MRNIRRKNGRGRTYGRGGRRSPTPLPLTCKRREGGGAAGRPTVQQVAGWLDGWMRISPERDSFGKRPRPTDGRRRTTNEAGTLGGGEQASRHPCTAGIMWSFVPTPICSLACHRPCHRGGRGKDRTLPFHEPHRLRSNQGCGKDER